MKWILLSFFLVARVSAQDYTCVDIAKMDEAKFGQLLRVLKENVKVKYINPKDIRKEMDYINRYYNQTQKYKKCFALRDIYTKSVENLDRAVGLGVLSQMTLNTQEKQIYNQRVSENKRYFYAMSRASYVSKQACNYRLIYLDTDYSKDGKVIVYEKRIVKGKIKSLRTVKTIENLVPMCGRGKALQQYKKYLYKKGLDVDLEKEKVIDILEEEPNENIDIYNPNFTKIKRYKNPGLNSNRFITIGSLKAIKVSNSRSIVIKKGHNLTYLKENKEEIFFKFNNSAYRAIKEYWNKYTKRISND